MMNWRGFKKKSNLNYRQYTLSRTVYKVYKVWAEMEHALNYSKNFLHGTSLIMQIEGKFMMSGRRDTHYCSRLTRWQRQWATSIEARSKQTVVGA